MNSSRPLFLLSAATIFPIASSVVAKAQVSAKVPFEFSVGNRTLPAGDYVIERDNEFLRIENRDSNRTVTLMTLPGDPSHDSRSFLSFDLVDGVYYFRRVATPSASSSVEVSLSKAEKQAQESERRTLHQLISLNQ